VISLPPNVFYGACLLILRKQRPPNGTTRCCWPMPHATTARVSNQNELRPQDVMRILVHVHAYGDAAKVPELVVRQQAATTAIQDPECSRCSVDHHARACPARHPR
jgi:type I restriction enzyme M protein